MDNSISIIIPTFNRTKELLVCIENLYAFNDIDDDNVEIIVSNDNSQQIEVLLFKKFPSIKFIEGPKKGPAANRNYAGSIAKGKWLIFLDDDCIPQENWLRNYSTEISKNACDILEGKTISNRPKHRYDEVAPINLNGGKLWSCNFAIQKNTFLNLKGFDENYPFSTMEDIDFKERAKKISDIFFIENSVVIHPWRRRIAFKNFKLRIKSQRYFAKKFPLQKSFEFKSQRFKIFVGSIFSNLIELYRFKFRGWTCYVEKMIFNLVMIFI